MWRHLLERLSEWNPDWRTHTGLTEPKFGAAGAGAMPPVSNERAFEAFATALLSGNTRWDRIESVRGGLSAPFCGFKPERFARLSDQEIDTTVLRWFRERRAGAAGLRGGLMRLRGTAGLLAGQGRYLSAKALLDAAFAEAQGWPEAVAMLLGSHKDWKLSGFGIALAAEGLRLLGYDLCKPDRHILRAVGSWGLVHFARWDRKGEFTAPQARPPELLKTMLAVRSLAEANDVPVSHANSVIWTAGAVSGARLTNREFAELA